MYSLLLCLLLSISLCYCFNNLKKQLKKNEKFQERIAAFVAHQKMQAMAFDELRQENDNLKKQAMAFDELRQENDNLKKQAMEFEKLRQTHEELVDEFEEMEESYDQTKSDLEKCRTKLWKKNDELGEAKKENAKMSKNMKIQRQREIKTLFDNAK